MAMGKTGMYLSMTALKALSVNPTLIGTWSRLCDIAYPQSYVRESTVRNPGSLAST